jgi:hypothetical protein
MTEQKKHSLHMHLNHLLCHRIEEDVFCLCTCGNIYCFTVYPLLPHFVLHFWWHALISEVYCSPLMEHLEINTFYLRCEQHLYFCLSEPFHWSCQQLSQENILLIITKIAIISRGNTSDINFSFCENKLMLRPSCSNINTGTGEPVFFPCWILFPFFVAFFVEQYSICQPA